MPRTFLRNLGLLMLCLGPMLSSRASAAPPSFDCGKAAEPVEKLICGNDELSALDVKTADAFKQAMAREGTDREMLLADQRRWLVDRQEGCRLPNKLPIGNQLRQLAQCINVDYSQHIKALNQPIVAADKMCQSAGQRLQSLEEAGHKDWSSLIRLLGLTPATPVESTADDSNDADQLIDGFHPSGALRDKIEEWESPPINGALYRVGHTPIYALLSTTHWCSDYLMFSVEHMGEDSEPPADVTEDHGACYPEQSDLGSIDNEPVFLFEPPRPVSRPALRLITYRDGAWQRECFVEPEFSTKLTVQYQKCEGVDCAKVVAMALDFARRRDRDPHAQLGRPFQALSKSDQAKFLKMEEREHTQSSSMIAEDAEGNTSYIGADFVDFPVFVDKELLLGQLGHAESSQFGPTDDYIFELFRLDGYSFDQLAIVALEKDRTTLKSVRVTTTPP